MRSGINMSASPDPSAGPEGSHEGLDWHKCWSRPEFSAMRLVLHLSDLSVSKLGYKLIYLWCLLCQSREEQLADTVRHMLPQSIRSCAELRQLSALRFTICIYNIYIYLILKFHTWNIFSWWAMIAWTWCRHSPTAPRHVVCFDYVGTILSSDRLKPCVNPEGDTRLSITPPVSGLH